MNSILLEFSLRSQLWYLKDLKVLGRNLVFLIEVGFFQWVEEIADLIRH